MRNTVRAKRLALGMSQQQLCEKAEISRTTVYLLEQGDLNVLKSSTMLRIAKALESPVSEVFLL